jgi:serine/threonine protein phosphatase 1
MAVFHVERRGADSSGGRRGHEIEKRSVSSTPRTLAIGDIHGWLMALDALLAAVRPVQSDLVITLGDYVDRGPDVRGVIERVIELDRACRLVPLRGNHELMMLEARREDFDFWFDFGGRETLASYGSDGSSGWIERVPATHWEFIEQRCVDYHETAANIFVHAGLDPDRSLAEQEPVTLFWQKLIPSLVRPHVSGKAVVCGHTAQHTGVPLNLGHLVCIDTWVYGDGWLTCLDVDTGRIWQANQAGELREGWLDGPRLP